jgi:hypothetical protein
MAREPVVVSGGRVRVVASRFAPPALVPLDTLNLSGG